MKSETKKLTRTDIVNMVSQKHNTFVKEAVKTVVNATLDALADAIASGNLVEIRRLGVFSSKKLAARRSRNPRTGETITVPPYRGVKYRISTEIKEKLSKLSEQTDGTSVD